MNILLQGNIEYMPLPDLLQWVEMNRKTCVLNIDCEGLISTFYMENGKIIYAASQFKGFRLGEFLVGKGVLNEAQLLHAITESRRGGILLTRFLINAGYISPDVLTEVFTHLVLSLLQKIIQMRVGSFTVTSSLPDSMLNGPIRLDVGGIVLESVRQLDERARKRQDAFKSLGKIKTLLEKNEFQLPVLPNIIMRLSSAIEDENTTFQEIARIIMTDQVLISRILKVANSPVYSTGGQIDSIHMAIARMGMRNILNISTAIKLNEVEFSNAPRGKLQVLLDDALKTALVASGLARHCRLDPEEAFLGGLLHDMGKTVIMSLVQDASIDSAVLDEFIAEHHAEIGAQVAQKWNYPESISNLIRNHHNSTYSGSLDRSVAVVQLADSVVQSGLKNECDPELMAGLNLQQDLVRDIYLQAMETFNNIKNF